MAQITKYPTSTVNQADGSFAMGTLTGVQQDAGAIASGAINTVSTSFHTMRNTGFNFEIPSDATITGIQVEIKRHASNSEATKYITDKTLRLLKAGTPVGNNKADTSYKWEKNAYYQIGYGNEFDLWGDTWTPSDINNANFGVDFQIQGSHSGASTTSADVDFIRVTVFYTTPPVAQNYANSPSILQNLESKYSVEILDEFGTVIGEFSGRASERSMKFVRNDVYEASWSFDLDDFERFARIINVNPRSILSIGRNTVRIKRNGVALFGGQIIYYDTSLSDKKTLQIKAVGWLELFKDRYTGPSVTYTGIDAGQIAWDLIDDSQVLTNGSFGITQGTIQASVNRNRTYEYKSIKDALIQLSQVASGFDFEFTHDKKFNVFYPSMGATRTEFEFTYPGNIKSMKISTDATKLLNYAIVRGQGFGEGQIIDVRQDTAFQTLYKRREAIKDYSDIPDVATLQQLGDEDINAFKNPLEIIEVTLDGNRFPQIGAYWLGDRVKTIVQDLQLYQHINDYYRIDEISVNIDEDDSEEVTLKLTL